VLWEQFIEVFYSAYFSKHKRGRKIQEFLDLQQGGATLAEFTTIFQGLERYCPNVYNTEEERAMKFAGGLKQSLKMRVYTRGPKSLDEAIEVATLLEQD
jgi:hypothetical protein